MNNKLESKLIKRSEEKTYIGNYVVYENSDVIVKRWEEFTDQKAERVENNKD